MGRYHDGPCDYHPPFLVSSVAPTSASLGYPLRIGDIWLDVSGGIGVQRRCTVLHDDGTGTWVLDGAAVVKLPLGDADTPGGVLAWRNPEGADILVTPLHARLTTSTADPEQNTGVVFGVAPDATTFAADMSGIATDNGGDAVIRSISLPTLVSAAHYITGSRDPDGPSVAGLAGYAYVYYHLA